LQQLTESFVTLAGGIIQKTTYVREASTDSIWINASGEDDRGV
jgi:hypothetical protein